MEDHINRLKLVKRQMFGRASIRETLETMLHGWIDMACPVNGPCSCFLTLSGVSGDAPAVARDMLLRSLNELKLFLAVLIARGQETGEFASRSDPDGLATYCVIVLQGVVSTARAGWGRDELCTAISEALSHLIGAGATV